MGLSFIDNVNVLTYGRNTKDNCKTLEKSHKACKMWTHKHGSIFALTKYKLIHLTRSFKKFNMAVVINIKVQSKTNVKVLCLQIDTKLK